MSITGLVILAMPAITMFHIERAMEEEKEVLEQMEYDMEVKLANENEETKRNFFLSVTTWADMPKFMKAVLITGNFAMGLSCYLVMGASEACFKPFTMKDSIEKDLGGNGWSLIKPPGFIAICLFLYGSLCLYIFQKWASRKTNIALAANIIVGSAGVAYLSGSESGASLGSGASLNSVTSREDRSGGGLGAIDPRSVGPGFAASPLATNTGMFVAINSHIPTKQQIKTKKQLTERIKRSDIV